MTTVFYESFVRSAGPQLPPGCTGTEATLAFPSVLAEARRWGMPEGDLVRLLPGPLPGARAVRRALAALRLELFSVRRAPGKLKYLAGTESGMGVFVNDVTPESTAERLREALS